jgi:hypothetical protein
VIAPRLLITYRGVEYAIEQRGEAWAILIGGAAYFLTTGDPDGAAVRFLRARMTNVPDPQRPAFIASLRYPLLLDVDGVQVRAWPALIPRGTGATTYINPATGDRVATTKDAPYWMLAARGRDTAPVGSATAEQTVADVEDLAKIWLAGGN